MASWIWNWSSFRLHVTFVNDRHQLHAPVAKNWDSHDMGTIHSNHSEMQPRHMWRRFEKSTNENVPYEFCINNNFQYPQWTSIYLYHYEIRCPLVSTPAETRADEDDHRRLMQHFAEAARMRRIWCRSCQSCRFGKLAARWSTPAALHIFLSKVLIYSSVCII